MDLEAKKEAPETPEKHNKVDYILHDTIYTCSVFSIQYNTFNLHLPVLFSMVGNNTTRRWEWEKGKDYIHIDQLEPKRLVDLYLDFRSRLCGCFPCCHKEPPQLDRV